MNLKILAQNVRRLRTAKRFSQKTLAESAGLSLPAVKNLEGAKVEPRMSTLQSIAGALEVRLEELFYPVRELKTVRFRSNKQMRGRENLLADIARWLDNFNYLEKTLEEHIPFTLKKLGDELEDELEDELGDEHRGEIGKNDVVDAAKHCRKSLGLRGTEPIHDICGLLEHAGVKVFSVSMASDGFFGLSIGEEDDGPAIVVNGWKRISVERRIFSAAHELAHLMLHRNAYDVSHTEENKEEERQANLFAGHFLLPDEGFRKEWNEAAGLALVDRVFKVKRIFRVSYKAILVRLIECGAVDKGIWKRFNRAYQGRYRRKLTFKEEPMGVGGEPFGMHPFDFFEDRLSRLTRKAVEMDKISLSRGAEILRISIEEMQELLTNWEVVL